MSRVGFVSLCAIAALVAFISAALLPPVPVLAASGVLTMETSLLESPDVAAPVIALLSEGTAVAIDGPPVNGFYPVIAGNLSGWMPGDTLSIEKDTPESVAPEEMDADLLVVDDTGGTVATEDPAALDPAVSTALDPGSNPATDASAAEKSLPVSEPTSGAETVPVGEPVPVEAVSPANASVPVEAPAADGVMAPSEPALDSTGASAAGAPSGESPPLEDASSASAVVAEPTIDPNVAPIPVPEVAAAGPASVMVDAPILLGPGPEYGFITTAPAGSTVQKTGHVIAGYATVQYAEVTGWLAVDHLGAPGPGAEETPLAGTDPAEVPLAGPAPADAALTDAPPAETALTTTSSEAPLADAAPSEASPAETAPAESAPIAAAPVDAALAEVTPVAAP
jgi:hypothetical protein